MTQTIQYKTHLILQSKYKFVILVIINMIIYIPFYYNNISYCMMDDNPEITSTQVSTELLLQQEVVNLKRQLERLRGEYSFEMQKLVHYQSLDGVNIDSERYSRLYEKTQAKLNVAEAENSRLKKELEAQKQSNNSYIIATNIICSSFFLGSLLYVIPRFIQALPIIAFW